MSSKRILLYLIYLSLATVVLDGLIGLDIFLNTTVRFAFLLSIVWFLKVTLVLPLMLRSLKKIFRTPLYLVLVIFMFMNIIRGVLGLANIDAFLSAGFFYILVILGGAAGAQWSKIRNTGQEIFVSQVFVRFIVVAITIICLIYFSLYINGYIVYFGLGIQSYIVTAAILSDGSTRLLMAPFLITILTGKRGLLIVLLAQYSQLVSRFIRQRSVISTLAFVFLLVTFGITAYNYDLFERFKPIFEISWLDIINYGDPETFNRLYLATSGRSNEIFSFVDLVSINDLNFWIGYPSDFSFEMFDIGSDVLLQHHYFHVSPINYALRFGFPTAIFLFIVQLRVVLYCLRFGISRKDIGLLIYVGYFFAMFFGAIVVIDILYWVTFGYAFFQMRDNRGHTRAKVFAEVDCSKERVFHARR